MERAKASAHKLANAALNPTSTTTPSGSTTTTTTDSTPSAPPLNQSWSITDVLSTLPHPIPTHPTSPLTFLHTIERLKTTPREGWRRFGVPNGESIADHMYRMSILTLLAPEPLRSKLDVPRCTLLALVHDMGESLVGDITPMDRVPKPEKHRREAEAMGFLTTGIRRHHQSKSVEEAPRGAEVDGVDGSSSQLPPSEANNGHSFPLSHGLLGAGTGCEVAGEMLRSAWDEYEADETLEAHFVHDVDKLELVLQMMEYERRGNGKVDLGEFVWVAEGLRLEEMKAWCREVLREREQFWIERGKEGVTGRDVAKRVLSEEGR